MALEIEIHLYIYQASYIDIVRNGERGHKEKCFKSALKIRQMKLDKGEKQRGNSVYHKLK